MISYAQNLEDVLLQRCFAEKQRGFYIDVGAMHPLLDSVTYAFYERGWCGLNFEPNEEYHALLTRFRPRDINLKCALSDSPGVAQLHVLAGTGLSTLDAENWAKASEQGHQASNSQAELHTLAEICSEFRVNQIDFLKVDVEGWEEKVLRGNDWKIYRPAVVLVEATLPNSHTPSWSSWDPVLHSANYDFVFFDGLNRYYVAQEHAKFKNHFKEPANWFDGYLRFSEAAVRDLLTAGRNSSWRSAYLKQLDSLALSTGEELDEILFCRAWDQLRLDEIAAASDIEKCYSNIVNRPSDVQGRTYWLTKISIEGLTVRQLIREFLKTEEFLNLRLKASVMK
jgi:FkbM family methyltransferase